MSLVSPGDVAVMLIRNTAAPSPALIKLYPVHVRHCGSLWETSIQGRKKYTVHLLSGFLIFVVLSLSRCVV